MAKFVQFVKNIPKPSAKLRGDDFPGVRVAIIDDGTDLMEGTECHNNIRDGRSFCTKHGHNQHQLTAPYYFSATGHGTVMAQYLLRMCPIADLYIARLDIKLTPNSRFQPTIASATKVSVFH